MFLGITGIGIIVLAVFTAFVLMMYRTVVPTNEVHIVQTKKETLSYGKDTKNGNIYYKWPASWPVLGVTSSRLPVSVFDVDLQGYEAYDVGRLPFVVDVKAFFRIEDSNVAAQRVASVTELLEQLTAVVQGAIRAILSGSPIEEILQGRSKFGDAFTKEVETELKSWGVVPVKNIELMDIRDTKGSAVIHNIMEKKKSLIEMQSRLEVAENMKKAQIAEVEAKREVDIQKQEAEQQVGLRTVEAKRKVDVAEEERKQIVTEQNRITAEKAAEVERVQKVKSAEIAKQAQIIKAEETKATAVLKAEQDKETQLLAAEAKLESTKKIAAADLERATKEAEGVAAIGRAKAEAESAMLLAPVTAQTTLAKEIGDNEGYQKYLIAVEQMKVAAEVGGKQAEALAAADIKIIANSSDATSGMNKLSDLLSANGGFKLGTMFEGLSATEFGSKILNKAGLGDTEPTPPTPPQGNPEKLEKILKPNKAA